MQSFDLATTFVDLNVRGGAAPLPVGDDFWETVGLLPSGGRLLSVIHSDGDWPNWEMHPEGDEVIMLLSGALTLLVENGSGIERVAMAPGQTVVMPRGTWHSADIAEPGKALFITPGDDTRQRPR